MPPPKKNQDYLQVRIGKCNICCYRVTMKTTTQVKVAPRKWHGQKWLRDDKRLAIYLRDGLACCWCGTAIEDGDQLTLDHIIPHSAGGKNEETNIVTACRRCNSSRGDRSIQVFAVAVATYLNHGHDPKKILAHIRRTVRRPLDRAAAKELIARRGTFSDALKG